MEYTKIQLRRDVQSNWNRYNPVLRSGEVGVATDLNKFKIGDGLTAFVLLPWATMSADELDQKFVAIDAKINEIGGAELKERLTAVEEKSENNANAITALQNAGYLDLAGVTALLEKQDYATNTRVDQIENKIPADAVNEQQVNTIIDGKNYVPKGNFATVNGQSITDGGDIEVKGGGVTMPEVEAKIAENTNGYQTSSDVESTIAGKNYVPQNSFATVNSQSITNGGNINIEAGGFEVVNTQLTLDENYYQDSVLTIEPNKIYKLTADPYDLYNFNLQLKHNGSFNGVAYLVWDDDECRIFDILGTYDNIEYFKVVGEIIGKNFQHYVEVVGVSGNAIINIDPIKEEEEKVTVGSVNGISLATGANVNGFVERTIRVTADNSADNRILIGQEIKNNGNYLFKFEGTPSSDGKLYIEIYSGPGIGGFYMLQWSNNLKIKDIDVTYGKREINRKGSVKDISQLSGFEAHYAYVFPYEETIFFTDGLFDSTGGGVTMSEVEAKIAENTNGYQTAEQVNAIVDGKGFAKESNLKTINGEPVVADGGGDIQTILPLTYKEYTLDVPLPPDSYTEQVFDLKNIVEKNNTVLDLTINYSTSYTYINPIRIELPTDKTYLVRFKSVTDYKRSVYIKDGNLKFINGRFYTEKYNPLRTNDTFYVSDGYAVQENFPVKVDDLNGIGYYQKQQLIQNTTETQKIQLDSNQYVIYEEPITKGEVVVTSGAYNTTSLFVTGPDLTELTFGSYGLLPKTVEPNTLYMIYIQNKGVTLNIAKIANLDRKVKWEDIIDAPTIPTNNNQLANGAGYITNSDVESKGYQTEANVEAKINANTNGFQTADQVNATVDGKGFAKENNLKTINGETIIGTGNIEIQGGGGGDITIDTEINNNSTNAVENGSIAKEINDMRTSIPNIINEEWIFTMEDGSQIRRNMGLNVNSFYFENISNENGEISLKRSNELAPVISLQYSKDNGKSWQEWSDIYNTPITISPNSRVYLKGTNQVFYEWKDGQNYNNFSCNKNHKIGGDITSLLVPDTGLKDLSGRKSVFSHLFYNDYFLIDAKNLLLPSTILSEQCYSDMFTNCALLISTPQLPAMKLARGCYTSMFSRCGSLVNAPILPAIELDLLCYNYMFTRCTSLVIAPKLPATILVDDCYPNMFSDCTSLVVAPELPAMIATTRCYQSMFSGCTSLVIAPKLPATTINVQSYSYMFSGCTSLEVAPELPATVLGPWSYDGLFKNCHKINNIKVSATSWGGNSSSWVEGVSATGTFTKPAGVDIPFGVDGIPEGWTVVDV